MLFSSAIFLFAFLPITFLVYYMINPKFRNIWLFLVSVFFYAWGEPRFVLIMLFSIIMNYGLGLLADNYRGTDYGRVVIITTVILNLVLFFCFKYLNFTIQNLNSLLKITLPQTHILLPIGISFFTFQAMSYVFDVYKGNGNVQKNPFYVGLYITFFPQLIAGPIVRYETVSREINCRKENFNDISTGIERFIIGLGKKVIISNQWAILADYAFNMNQTGNLHSASLAWIGAIAYAFQILFDFSGYSDMAIGLGKMFGFHFLENFNYPYFSESVSEFWRRWHISLGSWFRDYIYIPLGGSRVKQSRLICNLFIVWLLTGVWHGANWTFILWGLWYFILLAFEKLTGYPKRFKNIFLLGYYRIWTLFCILIGWVLFRSSNVTQAFNYIKCMFSFRSDLSAAYVGYLFKDNFILLIISIVLSVPILKWLSEQIRKHKTVYQPYFNIIYSLFLVLIFVIAISFVVNTSYDPFIYFNF